MALAVWLSLGPRPQSYGRTLQGIGVYGLLYDFVPGFEGLRAPARYAMIASLFLAVSAGFGAAAISRRFRRPAVAALAISALFTVEALFAPMPIGGSWRDGAGRRPAGVERASRAPAVYRHLATLGPGAVLVEFPFGDAMWDLRYMYYSTVHWARLVNGYSGFFPRSYSMLTALLRRVADQPDAAWRALVETGTTHVLVHEAAMTADDVRNMTTWLESRGARLLQRFEHDVLYGLPANSTLSHRLSPPVRPRTFARCTDILTADACQSSRVPGG
jgi:hypothetical protein